MNAPIAVIDAAHLASQRAWSRETFGPGTRLRGVLDHIRKELREIEASPGDVEEWVDVIILAFDGAWRAGWEPQQIIDAIKAKQAKNEARTWPDWRTADPNAAIEHVRRCGLHAWGADHRCVTCGAAEPHVRPAPVRCGECRLGLGGPHQSSDPHCITSPRNTPGPLAQHTDTAPPNDAPRPLVDHAWTPGKFSDRCQVMLTRYRCPYPEAAHRAALLADPEASQ